jgi:predicted unusual protein kinase regulating ubiquinone biosynthesis (AarF/ABC1/UbiB family)
MKSINSIPTSKIARAKTLLKTGVQVGGNYTVHYTKKLLGQEVSQNELDKDNASAIYDGLKTMKGSALKVAQMLSMEKNMLPEAYYDQFSLAQFSVPPLSYPLVQKTFKRAMGQSPEVLFDLFEREATHAASIGQVHKAYKAGHTYAVKIQYPGVADSIVSDLKLVKPVALKMFNINAKDSEKYFQEVQDKLLEEPNYTLELEQSEAIAQSCAGLENIVFPRYYASLSAERILTMDWMEGQHIQTFAKNNQGTPEAQQIGQTLWDFYMYQMHVLKKVHADPHPGNFLVDAQNRLIPIDFGCMKQVPDSFYAPYFALATAEAQKDRTRFDELLWELEILVPSDDETTRRFVSDLFHELLSLFTLPFQRDRFDFSDPEFWGAVGQLSKRLSSDQTLRKMNGNRGSKHFLYINRTFYGLYNLLFDLGAVVDTRAYIRYMN